MDEGHDVKERAPESSASSDEVVGVVADVDGVGKGSVSESPQKQAPEHLTSVVSAGAGRLQGLRTAVRVRCSAWRVAARESRPIVMLREWVRTHGADRRVQIGAGLFVLVCLLGAGGVYWYLTRDVPPSWTAYEEVYRLVPEAVSQRGFITVRVPEEVATGTPEMVRFEPELAGDFVAGDDARVLYYKPHEPLVLDSYYTVAFEDGAVALAADFRAVEDPQVVSILPASSAEVHEDSEVSVIFNRPMVPLSTRDVLDKETVPVRLSPDTPGVWKWKSTRLLQFVPEEALTRATGYTVTVNEGFRSLDGVRVPGFTHTFTTRTLKYDTPPDTVRFDAPLEIHFNQSVDLARTAKELRLIQNGTAVEPIVSYATKEREGGGMFSLVLFGQEDEVDTTRLWVRPAKDAHGREGYWDFDASYELSLPTQYPTEGDIISERALSWAYTMPSVLSSLAAFSERSDQVEPELFDPEGELVATFYEPVDKDKTTIALTGLRDVRYGTKCIVREDGREVKDPSTGECKREDNKQELRIRVDPAAYPRGSEHTLTFERVVRETGEVLNREPIVRTVRAIPEFRITEVSPEAGTTTASLTFMSICSTAPIERPENIRDVLRTEGYVVYPDQAWSNSYRVYDQYSVCPNGDFITSVRYGLHPETAYRFTLALTDHFGAQVNVDHAFTTGPAPAKYTRFHNLQKWYNATVPGKTRLTYATENLPAIAAHVCKVAPETMLHILDGALEVPAHGLPSGMCTTARTAMIDLPDTYWVNNYFHFDLAEYVEDVRGHYIITFTHAAYRDEKGVQQYDHTLLSVSDLAVGHKRVSWYDWYGDNLARGAGPAPTDLYWVLNARTLLPVQSATVAAYRGQNDDDASAIERYAEALTGTDGVSRVASDRYARGAVVTHGTDTAVVSKRTDTLAHEYGQGTVAATYVYTDRPLYKQGDTVHLRGIDRVGYDQSWVSTPGYVMPLTVRDSSGEEIYHTSLTVSDYGTFDTSFDLPADAPLGGYSIEAGEYGYGSFSVEAYVGAAFKVSVTPDETEHIAGDTASFTIDAQYYFDMPVADAEVEYTVLAQDYWFDRYQDEYFEFGAGWYTCYWCGYGDTFITRGTVVLDAEGKGTVEVPLDFAKHFDDPEKTGSKLYTLIARVSDTSGKQVVGQDTMIVHRGEYYLGVKTEPYFAGVGQEVALRVKGVNTEGVPIALGDVRLIIEKVEWESYKRREVDGGYYWHSEETRTPVETRTIRTDKDGNAREMFAFAGVGRYAVRAERVDARGNTVRGETQLYVWGEGDVSTRPLNNESLTLIADKPSYRAGETATVIAESPYTSGRALITVERGDIYEYWSAPVTGGFVTQGIPLRDSYAPGVHASVLLVGPGPEVKYGSLPLSVESEAHTLTIEATPDKKAYLPGEDVVLRVRTRDAQGAPVAAEVSVAVADLSVLALVGNPKKDPVSFFYGGVPLGVSTAHSAKNLLVEMDIPTGTKGGGGGEDLAKRKRGTFRDTAYWSARVVTDAQGEATVRFTLPDNLTTWQIEALGVTEDTRLGVQYGEFTSKKPLMAIPIRPRFAVPGDTMLLGMQVMNNTDEEVLVRTWVTSDTLTVDDTDERTVHVDAGKQKVVYFAARAPKERTDGSHVAVFHAIADGHEDVVEAAFPIRKNRVHEVTATAGMTRSSVFESIYIPRYALEGEGELTVRAQSTLAGTLLTGLREVALYPYGCSEQIASRLASLALLRKASTLFGEEAMGGARTIIFGTSTYSVDETISAGLTELLGRQRYDGGFSFYADGEPSVYLTVEVLAALTAVREEGYAVDDDVFARAAAYVGRELTQNGYLLDHDTLARVVYALSSPYVPAHERARFTAQVQALARDALALERLNTTALAYLTLATQEEPYDPTLGDTYFNAFAARLTIDARGAYVRPLRETYSWFSSNEKNTALLVRAIARRGGEHPALDNMLRWLRRGMRHEGGWGSTNTTYAVADAVLRLAAIRKEHAAMFDLVLEREGDESARFSVRPETAFDVYTHVFPLDSFARERLTRVSLHKDGEAGGEGTIYYDMQLRYALPPELLPPRDEGFTVERTLIARNGEEIRTATVGDLVTGKVTIVVPKDARAVSVESFIPAGFELVNTGFATEEVRDLMFDEYGNEIERPREAWWYEEPTQGPMRLPVTKEELHDDRAFAFVEYLAPGTYVYEYTLRALVPGTYTHMPAVVSEMYTPEVYGRSDAGMFEILEL